MASPLSATILILFFFLFLSCIPSQCEKTELPTKKKLAPTKQTDEILAKKKLDLTKQVQEPPTKKKKQLAPSKQVEEGQPIKNQTKILKPKKPKSNSTTTTTTATATTIPIPKSKSNKTQTLIPKPPKSSNTTKIPKTPSNPTTKPTQKKVEPVNPDPIWLDDPSEEEDLISEFRDLPTRIHEAFLPDLKKISITSKAYIYRANRELTSKVKPFVGKNFAPKIALAASCVFLIMPLLLVTLLFYQLNSYLSLQRFLLFAQAYLAIYFLTLSLTAVVTGLEPLRFFYATSPSSYAWTQAVQTLAYVLYLLVQLINLLVVFSAGEGGVGPKALGLAQVVVGLAVGLHYYSAVFHRAVTGDPPRANWKVHGVYAGCFLLICLFARAERRKKAYDGGEDGKVN